MALYLAARHPDTPWVCEKLFVAGVVAYAFSPIDLIPDSCQLLGYLDDLGLDSAGNRRRDKTSTARVRPNVEPEPAKSTQSRVKPNRHGGDCRRLDSSGGACARYGRMKHSQ